MELVQGESSRTLPVQPVNLTTVLHQAGLLLSLRAAVNIALFTIVLPLMGMLVFSKKSTTSKDHWIARMSIFLLMSGTSILFLSATPPVMIIGKSNLPEVYRIP